MFGKIKAYAKSFQDDMTSVRDHAIKGIDEANQTLKREAAQANATLSQANATLKEEAAKASKILEETSTDVREKTKTLVLLEKVKVGVLAVIMVGVVAIAAKEFTK